MAAETGDRKHLMLKNGIYSLLSWMLPLFLALVVTPIIVRGLGNEIYGLYAVILGFISYSFSFGIGKTAAKYVAEYRASGETEKISEMVSAILWISLAFGLLAVTVVSATSNYLVANILLISPGLQSTAVAALYLAGVTILITMLSQVFQFVIQGLQRFDRFLLLTNLSALLLNLGSVFLVFRGFGVWELLIWNCIVILAVGLMFYLSVRRLLPEFVLRFTIKSDVWGTALKYAMSIIVYQVFGNGLLLFERAWIVRKFGTETLTFYVVPMTLCFYFHAFISSLVLVLFPVVNELLADREKLVRLYRTATKMILTLTAFFAITSIVAGRAFLGTWMNDDFAVLSYSILVLHVCTFAILSITIIAWQMTESFKAAALNALATIVWTTVSVPLMISLSDRWQSAGVALARFIGVIAYLPLIYYVERKILGGISARFWPPVLARIAIAGVCAGVVEWLVLGQLYSGWLTLALVGLAGLVIYMAVLALTGFFEDEEKQALKGMILRFRRA